jgi:hypothetical protein
MFPTVVISLLAIDSARMTKAIRSVLQDSKELLKFRKEAFVHETNCQLILALLWKFLQHTHTYVLG